ncbi:MULTISPECIES: RidA family protein [unclassified Tenacibaculum]|uniref:RidA family protein n=1 Tax=unclassified Tenacibaculum TaxID=2635139 RepID=UPI00237AE9CE|nr:RidA family protein [Tenacibaculum sp. L6]MDE0537023.1 RidA family protein [Tenacibaculum sp. L6]
MLRKTVNPEKLFDSTQYGFSQIVISNPGKLIFISGQVAWDENLNIVGENNLKAQTQKAIENLKIAIESVGGTMENIMMLRIYKVNYQNGDGPIINSILKENFGTKNPPASTWVSVNGLANEGFMIEIEAQAVI